MIFINIKTKKYLRIRKITYVFDQFNSSIDLVLKYYNIGIVDIHYFHLQLSISANTETFCMFH